MREIKFRAWARDQKEMCYDFLFMSVDSPPRIQIRTSATFSVVYTHVMQYTGLKDKNGKEIWEGDIVSYGDNVYPIVFNERMAQFQARGFCQTSFDSPWDFTEELFGIEVIGNVHENPKLLEDK